MLYAGQVSTNSVSRTNIALYTLKTLPNWLPIEKEVRDFMLEIFNSSVMLANITRSKYKIIKAEIRDKYIYITVQRYNLITEIKVGKFESVNNLTIKGNHLLVGYLTKKPPFNLKDFLLGVGAGVVVSSVSVLLLNK